jgi:hypothetical protein
MRMSMDGTKVAIAYKNAFAHLHKLPGYDPKAVLRAEAGSILKQWAGRTKVGTEAQATWRARYRAGKRAFGDVGGVDKNQYGISVNTGLKGGIPGLVWFRTRKTTRNEMEHRWQDVGIIRDNGQIGTLKNRHYAPEDWSRIIAGMEAYADSLAATLPFAKQSVGMARQAVIQIAHDLDIDLDEVKGTGISAAGIRKAENAKSSTNRKYKNGVGSQGGSSWFRAFVKLDCRFPRGSRIGMDSVLKGVLSGRAKYIMRSYKKGAFDSIAKSARAFPNVFREIRLASD